MNTVGTKLYLHLLFPVLHLLQYFIYNIEILYLLCLIDEFPVLDDSYI